MNITKYIFGNILSLLGNLGLLIALCAFYIFAISANYNYIVGLIAYLASFCYGKYIYIIPIIVILLLIEVLIHKITHNKFLLNIPFKNENIRCTYNILFWLGIICLILYIIDYIWFITR